MDVGDKTEYFSRRGARSSVGRSSCGKGPRYVLCFGNAARVSVLGLEHAAFQFEGSILSHAEQRTRDT